MCFKIYLKITILLQVKTRHKYNINLEVWRLLTAGGGALTGEVRGGIQHVNNFKTRPE